MKQVRVLVIAKDPLARAGLAALLADRPECTVVGQAASVGGLAAEVPGAGLMTYQPDVVLWDLGWDPTPDSLHGSDLEDSARVEDRVSVVALVSDESYAADAWASGVLGLLYRHVEPEVLVSALQAVAQGLIALDPELAAALLPSRLESPESLVEELTPREREVLQLLAEGLPNKTIALQLGISEHTVKFHVNAILGKLGVQSRTEAVVRAMRLGLIIL